MEAANPVGHYSRVGQEICRVQDHVRSGAFVELLRARGSAARRTGRQKFRAEQDEIRRSLRARISASHGGTAMNKPVVVRKVERPAPEVTAALERFGVSTIH